MFNNDTQQYKPDDLVEFLRVPSTIKLDTIGILDDALPRKQQEHNCAPYYHEPISPTFKKTSLKIELNTDQKNFSWNNVDALSPIIQKTNASP